MKIAVTTTAPEPDAPVDPRFGGAPYFLLMDTEAQTWQAFANPAGKYGGHGIVAARFVAYHQADAVISDDFCPHSFASMAAAGMQLYAAGENSAGTTASEMVARLQRDELAEATPSARHHHAHHAPSHRGLTVLSERG
jgi:predicted Fe-Mo cluster-binding NifX family protein